MSEDHAEYSPDTFEIYTEKTLQKLSQVDFKELTKFINTDRVNYFKFKLPDENKEKHSLIDFTSTILELSKISNIKQHGDTRPEIDGIIEDLSKGNLSILNIHSSEENNIADILLLLAEDRRSTQGRISIPFTGGNLGIWINLDRTISFTGNKRYDNAASLLTETSKKLNLKVK